MKSDKFSNVIYETSDIVDLIYKGQENLLDQILCEPTDDIKNLAEVSGLDIKYFDPKLYEISVEDFDRICQQDWFMPEEYQKLDIEEFIVNQCPTQHYQRLIEELQEYKNACQQGNLIEVADALGDQLYVLIGTILRHGMQDIIEEVFNEIHSSNMSKLDEDGKPVIREDGKILKGKNYFKPNLKKIFDAYLEVEESPLTKDEIYKQCVMLFTQ
jgi:hypothetical protein